MTNIKLQVTNFKPNIMLKKVYLFLIIIGLSTQVFAQISGISVSKIAAICAGTVPNKGIEFEPAFEVNRVYGYYDLDWLNNVRYSGDTVMQSSGMGFRFSYGLLENLEIGVSLPSDVSELGFGAKYQLPFGEKSKFAILAGADKTISNSFFNVKYDYRPVISFGAAYSLEVTDKFSIDANLQAAKDLADYAYTPEDKFYAVTDFGYYVTEGFQIALAAEYLYISDSVFKNRALTLTPGFTVERAENFSLLIGAPFSVWGERTEKSYGFFTALTIMID